MLTNVVNGVSTGPWEVLVNSCVLRSRTVEIARDFSNVLSTANCLVPTREIMCSSNTNNVKPSVILALKLATLKSMTLGNESSGTLFYRSSWCMTLLDIALVVAERTNSTVTVTVVSALCNSVMMTPSLLL